MPSRGRYSAEFQITAETEGLKRGFADARRQQQQFLGASRAAWQSFGRQARIGSAVAVGALVGFGAAGLNAAKEIDTLRRQTTLSAQQASRWRLAFRGAGGDISDVEDILRTLNSRVIEFAKGETTATDAFRALGASVNDFDLNDPNQQLEAFLRLLERAPHSAAQFAADELIGDTARLALQIAGARKEQELLQRSFAGSIADVGEISSQWRLISGFATAAAESVGISFLRGLTSGIGSSEELADVLRDDVLPIVRGIESSFRVMGEIIAGIGRGVSVIRANWPAALTPGWTREGFASSPVGRVLGAGAGGPEPVMARDESGQPREMVVTGRRITLHETPLHRRTQAISDRAIEGEQIAEARRRFLLQSIQPGPGDDPRGRLAQATPDFQSRFARQQDLAQQTWWSEFWQNTGRSLQQGLTSSIGGAVSSFVSGRDAGDLKALGDNLLQALSSTFARVFAQAVVDATVGQALTGVFSAAFSGAGAGTGAGIQGFYNDGGVVPGPVGRPQVALVHGGEAVFTPAQLDALGGGGDTFVFQLADVTRQSEEAINNMLDQIIAAVGRDRYERNLPA